MRGIRRPSHGTVVAYVALFVALGGGTTAVALNGQNTVQSDDLGPGAQVKAPDVAANAVNGSDVVDNSIAGADVNESSLGQVPSALLGGSGRSTSGGSCHPGDDYVACAVVTRTISRQARFLLIAQAGGSSTSFTDHAVGQCRIGTTAGPLTDTATYVNVGGEAPTIENVALVGVSPPLPPGQHSFGIDCHHTAGAQILFQDAGITAVAISPG